MTRPFFSLVIPTYNEAENIQGLCLRLSQILSREGVSFELIVVDDDSPDGTAKIVEELAKENKSVRLLRRRGQRGLGTAVVFGWSQAQGEILGVIDGDGQHPPEALPAMLRKLSQDSSAGLVVASRNTAGGGVSRWSALRRAISHVAAWISYILLPDIRAKVNDPMSGYFLLRRKAIEGIDLKPQGYKILLEVLAKAKYGRVAEVPYIFEERKRGGSKAGLKEYFTSLNYFWNLSRQTGQIRKATKNFFLGLLDLVTCALALFCAGLFFWSYGGVNNLSVFGAGLFFLLFLRWLAQRQAFFSSPLMRAAQWVCGLSAGKLLSGAVIILFLIFSALSIARNLSLSSTAYDLGIFSQAVWSTAQGDWFFSSLKGNINLLGDHFEPILALLAPLYKLYPSANTLLIAQALLLSSALIPLYLISRKVLAQRCLVLAFLASFMLSRPLRGVAYSDFHPECFILPFLFWAYYFLLARKALFFYLALFIALLCKEDAVLAIAAFGIYIFFADRKRWQGALLVIFAAAAWAVITKIVIPRFNPAGGYDYMSRLPFGKGYGENLAFVAGHPLQFIGFLARPEKIEYALKLFGPLAFLPLLSPAHYVLFGPLILRNVIPAANYSGWYDITSHYTAGIIPFVYIAAIYGAAWIIRKVKYKNTAHWLSAVILFFALMFYGKTDGYKLKRFVNTIREKKTLERLAFLKVIPAQASVAANSYYVPHLSCRKYIYEFNPQSKTTYITEYVVVDLDLLGYLSSECVLDIRRYLHDMRSRGYRQIFASPDQRLLILYNPDFEKKLMDG